MLPPKRAKMLKAHMLRCGESWNEEEWVTRSEKITVMRPPKGHKRDRVREERVDMILEKLAGMDEKIIKHKKAVKDRKPREGFRETLGFKTPKN